MSRCFRTLAFLCCCTAAAAAQQPPAHPTPSPQANVAEETAAMGKLAFMAGAWKGSGWIMLGPGKRAEFTQTEVITSKLNGLLLTIDGDGRDAANPDRHIHDAFGVISYKPDSHQYSFIAFTGGNMVDVPGTVKDHTFIWGFDTPYGKMRFTMDFSTGQWHETGELSRDNGATWMKNFEMNLARTAP